MAAATRPVAGGGKAGQVPRLGGHFDPWLLDLGAIAIGCRPGAVPAGWATKVPGVTFLG